MECIISFFAILAFIIYYSYFRIEKEEEFFSSNDKFYDKLPRRSKKSQKYTNKAHENAASNQEPKEKRKRVIDPHETIIVKNIKELILTSFKEGKDLISVHIQNDGKLILTSDDKRVNLFTLSSLHEKNPKCYTKKVDNDSITDVSVCGDKVQIAVGLKNAKEVIFYEIQKNKQDNKLKLQKIEKKVLKSDQKFEIRKVMFTRDGSYLATSGIIHDTKIHIYNGVTLQKLASIEINKIENLDLKFSKDEKFLTTSTYMNELGVIEFNLTMKFNKNSNTEEKILRIEKKKSISNIKYPIISYDFSNENNYFVLAANDRKIKIFQSFENLEDAKVLKEIDIEFEDENILPFAENVTMYVLESRKNEFDGIIACSYQRNIFLFSSNGSLLKYFPRAHEDDIIKLKILKDNDSIDPKGLALISVSKDGKVNIIKIN